MAAFRYVILGGGMVAGYAAKELADHGLRPGELGILSADDALPYERPPLSKGFLRGSDTEQSVLINSAAFYVQHGIEVQLGSPAAGLNAIARTITLRDGGEWRFEKLVIAAGAQPRSLNIPGGQFEGVHYLRSLDDSKRIRAHATSAKRAVVIGGGFIGMEVAASLAQRGLPVTMTVAPERLGPAAFTPEMSQYFQTYFEARGVQVLTGTTVTGIAGRGMVESVRLASGATIDADMVVAGIGVAPDVSLFQRAGIVTSDGIRVNEYLETNLPGIWAAGDIATYRDVLFETERRVEHWDNAVSQGQHVARALVGLREPFVHVPYFFSDVFDLSYEFWGDTRTASQVVTRGSLASNSFSVWWLDRGRVAAAFVLSRPEEERDVAQKWIRERSTVPADLLADASRPLKEQHRRSSA